VIRPSRNVSTLVWLASTALALAACDKGPSPPAAAPSTLDTSPPVQVPGAEAPVSAPESSSTVAPAADGAEAAQAAPAPATPAATGSDDLAAREKALAEREAQVAARERALAQGRGKAVSAPVATAGAGSSSIAKVATPPIVVPAGTALAIELKANVNTKTARAGDPVEARLARDVAVDGRVAVTAGALVTGAVTEVVSGSSRIGGVPTLGITFDSLVAANGATVPIVARFVQQGTSETGRDAAKILGGAAVGAVIGHQIDKEDRGTVIGGIVGGAAGAAAAKRTGGEVKLGAGTVVSVTTESSFSIY